MRIAIVSLIGVTALFTAACSGPAPGSAEWCKAASEGKIKPSEEDQQKYAMQCFASLMKEAVGNMQLPAQPGQ